MSKGTAVAAALMAAVIGAGGGAIAGVKLAQNKEAEIQNDANQVAEQQLAEKDKELAEQEALTIQISEDMAAAIQQKDAQISDLNTQITNLRGQLANSKTQAEYDAILAQLTAKQSELEAKIAEYNALNQQLADMHALNESQAAENQSLKNILYAEHEDVVNRVLGRTFYGGDLRVSVNGDGTVLITNSEDQTVAQTTFDVEHFRLTGIANIAASHDIINDVDLEAAEINFNDSQGYDFNLYEMYFENKGTPETFAAVNMIMNKCFVASVDGNTRVYTTWQDLGADVLRRDMYFSNGQFNILQNYYSMRSLLVEENLHLADNVVSDNNVVTINNLLTSNGENVPLLETEMYAYLEEIVGTTFESGNKSITLNNGEVDFYTDNNLEKTGTYLMEDLKTNGTITVTCDGSTDETLYIYYDDMEGKFLVINQTDGSGEVFTPTKDKFGIFDTILRSTYVDENGNKIYVRDGGIYLTYTTPEEKTISGSLDLLESIDAVSYDLAGYVIDIEFAQDGQSCRIVYLAENGTDRLSTFNFGTFQIDPQAEDYSTPSDTSYPDGWNDEYNLLETLRTLHYANDRQSLTLEFTYNDYTATIASVDGSMVMNTSVLIDGYTLTLTIDNGDGQTQQKVGTISADGRTITFGEEEVFVSTK